MKEVEEARVSRNNQKEAEKDRRNPKETEKGVGEIEGSTQKRQEEAQESGERRKAAEY